MWLIDFFKKITKKQEADYEEKVEEVALKECDYYEKLLNEMGWKQIFELLPQHVKEEVLRVEEQVLNMDKEKPTMLVIDDSMGLVSLLKDVIEMAGLSEKINVITIQTSYAGFVYKIIALKYPDIRFDFAIIDITYGGIIPDTHNGNLKYEGIMVFRDLFERNPKIKYLFYTGNSLNSYVYSSKKIIDLFKNITGKNIKSFVIYKNKFPPSEFVKIIKNLVTRKG